MDTIRAPSARCLPVRRKNGTPAHRQLSISQRRAMNVSVSESRATPSACVYPSYCPRTTSAGSIGRSDRNTLFFSSLIERGSSSVGGSMATKARTWRRWVTTMSRKAPVCS